MRLLILAALLVGTGVLAGCSNAKADDGTNNPAATRITDAEFEAKRAKKGGADSR